MLIIPKKSDLIWYSVLLAGLLFVVYIQYLSKNQYIAVTDFFVPDSYTYELRVLENIKSLNFAANTFNNFNRFIYGLGTINFLILNSSLLFLSVCFCKPVFGNISKSSIWFARFSIVTNLYFLIAAIGPNKEIILLFINMLFWFAYFDENRLFKKYSLIRILTLFLIASLPIFIRPYSSFPLYISLFLNDKYVYKPRKLVFIAISIFFLSNSIGFIANIYSQMVDSSLTSFSASRIFFISKILGEYSKDPLLQVPAFIAKAGIILFGPILRSFPIFSDPFPLLDFGYSVIALLCFPVNLSLIAIFMGKESIKKLCLAITPNYLDALRIFCFVGFSLIVVIVTPVTTFRYMFPFFPFIFAFIPLLKKRYLSRIFILSTLLLSLVILFTSTNRTMKNNLIPEFMNWL
jgi:hypothetical protein